MVEGKTGGGELDLFLAASRRHRGQFRAKVLLVNHWVLAYATAVPKTFSHRKKGFALLRDESFSFDEL